MRMPRTSRDDDLGGMLIDAWRTNARATALLVRQIPAALWPQAVPGMPRRSVRGIAAHLHNSRSRWIRTLGSEHGVKAPAPVSPHRVSRREVLSALRRSGDGIEALLELGLGSGGRVPPSRGYVWRNLPLDVGHVLTYFAAHEGHHRGQIVMIARQLGMRLPVSAVGGIWQWTTLNRKR
jgi:uncharacterized damage-inducible protein DinB